MSDKEYRDGMDKYISEREDRDPGFKSRVEEAYNKLVQEQDPPIPNEEVAVWDSVLEDMKNRDLEGLRKYGVRLQPYNGRDPSIDAYQEALDLIVYLKQSILEREQLINCLRDLYLKQSEIFEDPTYHKCFEMAAISGYPYSGPKVKDEMKAAEVLLEKLGVTK